MNRREEVFDLVERLKIPGFFITVHFIREGRKEPSGLENFIQKKKLLIDNGATGRKFVFREEEWHLVLTFFPTDKVVDEHYALKNKVQHIINY